MRLYIYIIYMYLEAQEARAVGAPVAGASVQFGVLGHVRPTHCSQAESGSLERANHGVHSKPRRGEQLGLGEGVNPKAGVACILAG